MTAPAPAFATSVEDIFGDDNETKEDLQARGLFSPAPPSPPSKHNNAPVFFFYIFFGSCEKKLPVGQLDDIWNCIDPPPPSQN